MSDNRKEAKVIPVGEPSVGTRVVRIRANYDMP